MLYTELLTPAERMAAIRMGAAEELMSHGVTVSALDGAIKSAASDDSSLPAVSLSAIANAAMITGVPIGLMYYIVDRSIRKSDLKTRKLQGELSYYNDVIAEMKNNSRAMSGRA